MMNEINEMNWLFDRWTGAKRRNRICLLSCCRRSRRGYCATRCRISTSGFIWRTGVNVASATSPIRTNLSTKTSKLKRKRCLSNAIVHQLLAAYFFILKGNFFTLKVILCQNFGFNVTICLINLIFKIKNLIFTSQFVKILDF